jgi:predicted ATPase
MRSWRVLHLDPAAMRESSYQSDPPFLNDSGYGYVRLLHAIAKTPPHDGRDPYEAETAVYARVAGAIWELLGEVSEISVEPVNERGELELTVSQRDGTKYSARALSDGTLRFLALAVLSEQEAPGLYCIEEPENGVHPGRIQALLDLLQAIAVDTGYPIEEGNPLRQVIISTHSPSVVMRVPQDSLVVAEQRDTVRDGRHFNRARFSGLANTWRDPVPGRKSLPIGALLTYLNPEGYRPLPRPDPDREPDAETRVMDRSDIHDLLMPLPNLDG